MMLEMIWLVAPRELAKLGIKVKALEDIEARPRLSSNRAQQHNTAIALIYVRGFRVSGMWEKLLVVEGRDGVDHVLFVSALVGRQRCCGKMA